MHTETQPLLNTAFSLKKEMERYLVGIDERGVERWFDRKKYDCWVQKYDGDGTGREPVLMVRLTQAQIDQRLKSVVVREEVPTTQKKCLRCRTSFGAEKGMFVCDPCKQTQSWRDGVGIYDL